MQKRKLVEISPVNHRKLTVIRQECRKKGKSVPSIPSLVDEALFIAMKTLSEKFCDER